MIRNDRQLANARTRLQSAQESAQNAADEVSKFSLNAIAEDARAEILEYESVRSGQVRTFMLQSLDDMGETLVKARLSQNMTQRELATKVGVTEQAVQKDESKDYENAGISRVADILDALGYEFVGIVRPKEIEREQHHNPAIAYGVEQHSFGIAPVLSADFFRDTLSRIVRSSWTSTNRVKQFDTSVSNKTVTAAGSNKTVTAAEQWPTSGTASSMNIEVSKQ